MVAVTLWLTIASGGSFSSSGIRRPAAPAGPASVTTATRAGRENRRNRMVHLRDTGRVWRENAVIIRRGRGAMRWDDDRNVTKGLPPRQEAGEAARGFRWLFVRCDSRFPCGGDRNQVAVPARCE